MKESTNKNSHNEENQYILSAHTLMAEIFDRIIEEWQKNELKEPKEKREWFYVHCPINLLTNETKKLIYSITFDDKTYDVFLGDIYNIAEDYGLFYYMDEEKIKFSMNKNDIELLHNYKEGLKKDSPVSTSLKHIKNKIKRKDYTLK